MEEENVKKEKKKRRKEEKIRKKEERKGKKEEKRRMMQEEKSKKKQEREQKQKQKQKKQKSLAEKFVHMVFMAVVFIIILMIISMICIIYSSDSIDKEPALESTLLSSGITIIGVAIAVWAGLNIIQVLEKDNFELLSKEVLSYRNERKMLNKMRFLDNVLSERNELNRYLYDKLASNIDEEDDGISSELYFELNIIETMFQLVYKEQFAPQRTIPQGYYNDAIEKCKVQMQQAQKVLKENAFIEQYLKICIIEFNFYKGYISGEEESRKCFQIVIDGFYEIFGDLKEPKKMIEEEKYIDKSIPFTIFMLNTVGEAYSKIIHSYQKNDARDKEALAYMRKQASRGQECYEALISLAELFAKLSKSNKKVILKEVYYRNYGALLERISNIIENNSSTEFNYNSKIREMYQKAMDITVCEYEKNIRFQTFQTWLSFYIKVIKENNIKGLLEGNSLKMDSEDTLKSYTNSASYYVKIALRLFPIKIFFMKCHAFIERDFAIWGICDSDFNAAYLHIKNLQEIVEGIYIVEKGKEELGEKFPDPFLKELTLDCNMLQEKIFELSK